MRQLERKNIADILFLTPLQQGMLFHYLQDIQNHQNQQYHEQLSLNLAGEMKVEHFEKAWQAVIKTNELLRTAFRWEKLETPTQIILKEHTCNILFYDLSTKTPTRQNELLQEIKEQDKQEPFDLSEVPFRVRLCKLARTQHEVIISNHHILYDGWSNGIIIKEFFAAYHNLSTGKNQTYPLKLPLRISSNGF